MGRHFFREVTYQSGLAAATLKKAGWSNGIYDFNNDGWKDLFAACAHVTSAEGNARDLQIRVRQQTIFHQDLLHSV